MRHFARSLVSDPHTAEDLVQGTMLRALRSPAEERGRPWLKRVMQNLARTQWRKDDTRADYESRLDPKPSEQSVDVAATNRDLSGLLRRSLTELREPYRTTLMFRYLEGRTSVEIASIQGVPEGTVRWRVKQGLAELRTRLDAEFDGGRSAWLPALAMAYPLAAPPVGAGAKGSGASPTSTTAKQSISLGAQGAGTAASLTGLSLQRVAAVVAVVLLAGWIIVKAVSSQGDPSVAVDPVSDLAALEPVGSIGESLEAPKRPGTESLRQASPPTTTSAVEPDAAAPATEPSVVAAPTVFRVLNLATQDNVTGKSIPGAEVHLISPDEDRVVATANSEGLATVSLDQSDFETTKVVLDPGSVSIRVIADGYVSSHVHSLNAEILEASKDATLTIPMAPGAARVEGRIVDTDGHPISGASVTVVSQEGGYRRNAAPGFWINDRFNSAVSGVDGEYSVAHVPTGPLAVRIDGPEYVAVMKTAAAESGEAVRIDAALRHGGTVRGVVSDSAGHPVPGALVWFESPRSYILSDCVHQPGFVPRHLGFGGHVIANAAGEYELRGLTTSTTRVWAQDPLRDSKLATVNFSWAENEILEWHPLLEERAPFAVKVTDAEGQPASGLALYIRNSQDDQVPWTRYVPLDGEGCVDLYDWVQLPVNISVHPVDLGGEAMAKASGVDPQQGRVEIQIRPIERVKLTGTIVDSDGAFLPDGKVKLVSRDALTSVSTRVQEGDGRFEADLSPGTFHPRVHVPRTGCVTFDPIELRYGEPVVKTFELPALVPLVPVLSPTPPAEGDLYRIRAHPFPGTKWDDPFGIADGAGVPTESLSVFPGVYAVGFKGVDGSEWGSLVVIEPGSEGRFVVEKGAPPFVTIRFGQSPTTLDPGSTMRITAVTEAGAEQPTQSVLEGTPADLAPCGRWIVQLAPGNYDVEVSSPKGISFAGPCRVGANGSPAVIEVPAR